MHRFVFPPEKSSETKSINYINLTKKKKKIIKGNFGHISAYVSMYNIYIYILEYFCFYFVPYWSASDAYFGSKLTLNQSLGWSECSVLDLMEAGSNLWAINV